MGSPRACRLLLANAGQFMLALFVGREAGIYSMPASWPCSSVSIFYRLNAVAAVHFSELDCAGRTQELIAAGKRNRHG